MKKLVWVLVIAMLVAAVAVADVGALAEEAAEAQWGIVYGRAFYTEAEFAALDVETRMAEHFGDMAYPAGLDAARMVCVNVRGYGPVWCELPEGSLGREAYWGKGVQLVAGGGLADDHGTVVLGSLDRIEVVGDAVRAMIFEIGEDYVEIRPMDADREYPARLTLTLASDLGDAAMIAGHMAEFVYDANDVVLYAMEAGQ